MSIGDVKSTARGTGARFNTGKHPARFTPLHLLEPANRVWQYGANKYAAWNWAKGMPWSVPYECILRHLAAWYRGEDIDPESGESHLGHIMCNVLMLEHYKQAFQEGDDRPKLQFQPGGIPCPAVTIRHTLRKIRSVQSKSRNGKLAIKPGTISSGKGKSTRATAKTSITGTPSPRVAPIDRQTGVSAAGTLTGLKVI